MFCFFETIAQKETKVRENPNLMRFTNYTHSFLSPSTTQLHNSLEKAKQKSSIVYTTSNLRAIMKQVIESIDHILNHDLVLENHNIARYVDVI